MKLTSMPTRITIRLDADLTQNLDLLSTATKTGKAKLIRMIMKEFFNNNEEQLDKYYEESKTN